MSFEEKDIGGDGDAMDRHKKDSHTVQTVNIKNHFVETNDHFSSYLPLKAEMSYQDCAPCKKQDGIVF